MAAKPDVSVFVRAFKNAARILEEIKTSAPIFPKTNFKDSVETSLEQYCTGKGLRWTREAGDGHSKLVYRVNTDFFVLEIHFAGGVVGDVWVLHQIREHHESCPQLAKALRLKDFAEFDKHVSGFLKMYTSADKSQRPKFFLCLKALEADLLNVHQHVVNWNIDPTVQVLHNPFGLISPRREGISTGLCFFITAADMVDRNMALMENSYHVIAARKLGMWVSVSVKECKPGFHLPHSQLCRSVTKLSDENISCEFAPFDSNNASVLNGTFILEFEKPFLLLDTIAEEIKQITGIEVPFASGARSTPFIQLLQDSHLPHGYHDAKPVFRVILPGQHHLYSLVAADLTGRFVFEIPFSHPSHIPLILLRLRKQAAMNRLLTTCMRVVAESAVLNPFVFGVTVSSTKKIAVEFSHPLNELPTKIIISLSNPVKPSCLLDASPALASDDLASSWLQKTFSIPVLLKSIIDYFVRTYVPPVIKVMERKASVPLPPPPPPPEPVKVPVPVALAEKAPDPPITPTIVISSPTSQPAVPTLKITKIERILSGPKNSHVKPSSSTPKPPPAAVPPVTVSMDQDIHAMKMKALYASNEKKAKLKKEPLVDKSKKRKLSMDIPPGMKTEPSDLFSEPPKSARMNDSPHGSPLTIKLKIPPATVSDAPTLQAIILNKESRSTAPSATSSSSSLSKKVKKQKTSETVPTIVDPPRYAPEQHKKLKRDPSTELEALLMRGKATTSSSSSHSPSKSSSSSKGPLSSTNSSTSSSRTLSSVASAKSPAPTVTFTLSAKSHNSSGSPSGKSPAPAPSTGTSKSPTPALPPLFSVPNVPKMSSSLSSLPRIPKKSAMTGTSQQVTVLPGLFGVVKPAPAAIPASPVTPTPTPERREEPSLHSQISVLLAGASSSPRPPLLPTPDMDPLPFSGVVDKSEKSTTAEKRPISRTLSSGSPAKSTIAATAAPSPVVVADLGGSERQSPKLVEKEKPLAIIDLMGTPESLPPPDDEAGKNLTIPIPVGDGCGSQNSGVLDVTTPPLAKGKHRSISAVLDRLKSRVEVTDGSSPDMADIQDHMFKQLTGGNDMTDGKDTTDASVAGSRPGTSQVSPESSEKTQSLKVTKQMLVPYSSGDEDSSSEDTTGMVTDVRMVTPVKPPGAAALQQQSPEIMERVVVAGSFQSAKCVSAAVVHAEESRSISVAPLVLKPDAVISSSGHSLVEHTSPTIIDDELLDSAFI